MASKLNTKKIKFELTFASLHYLSRISNIFNCPLYKAHLFPHRVMRTLLFVTNSFLRFFKIQHVHAQH